MVYSLTVKITNVGLTQSMEQPLSIKYIEYFNQEFSPQATMSRNNHMM